MIGKKVIQVGFFVVAMVVLALGGFSVQAQAASDPLQDLYAAAKAEGKVIFWAAADPEELTPIIKAFKIKYPGIEVEHFEIREGDFVPRLIAEARQGRVSLDMGCGKMAVLLPLVERDLIQAHRDWQIVFKDLHGELISENGRFLTWYHLVYPVAYNTKLLRTEDVPKTWEDLLDPKWKGKLLVEIRGEAFGYIGMKWGEDRIVSFMKKLKEQKPIFVKGGTTVLQQLNAGLAPIGIGTYLSKIFFGQRTGSPTDWSKTISPLGASNICNFIVKGGLHPHAAKLLAGFMSSAEGIRIQAQTVDKGPMFAGSPVPGAADIAKNKVELIMERSDNYKEINRYLQVLGSVLQ